MKKRVCSFLALCIALACMVVPAFAANGERYSVQDSIAHNQRVQAKADELRQKYAIAISYPTFTQDGQEVAGVFPETLETLDMALSYVTPYVVQQVSQYYQQTTGYRLKFTYSYQDMAGDGNGGIEMTVGGFDDKTGVIHLFIPRPGRGAMITGDAPMTIVHEFGHALHLMLVNKYDMGELEQSWNSYNQGIPYSEANIAKNPSPLVFISGYGATNYYEDFADTFAHGFVCSRPGLGLSKRLTDSGGNLTALGQKIRKVEAVLTTYFPDSTQAHKNFSKVFSTPGAVQYQGLTFSGVYLQHMGYPEARYLPVYYLSLFNDIPESGYTWIPELGGWSAKDSTGQMVVVFPELTYHAANR